MSSLTVIALVGVLCTPISAAKSTKVEKPASCTETIPGTLVKFEMVGIPAGEIKMPDPAKPGSTTKIKVPALWFGKTEVTWDEYDVFVFKLDVPEGQTDCPDAVSRPSKPYGAADRGFGHKGYPVINESYYGAEQYCKWLSQKTGHEYRLPNERMRASRSV